MNILERLWVSMASDGKCCTKRFVIFQFLDDTLPHVALRGQVLGISEDEKTFACTRQSNWRTTIKMPIMYIRPLTIRAVLGLPAKPGIRYNNPSK